MINFSYVYKGLCAMSRAHRANTMTGHLGAALVAGYLFSEDRSDLDPIVYRGIETELDRVIRGEEAIWYNAADAGISIDELFEPMPDEQPDPDLIPTIAAALEPNIDRTRQSGHNVIFAALAIRALQSHPQYATPSIVSGIVKLTEGFNNAGPGRGYYGAERGWLGGYQVQLPQEFTPPIYQDLQTMTSVMLDNLTAKAKENTRGFGGLWHLINHCAALIELDRLGYDQLAQKGLAAHHHHLRLWLTLPDVSDEFGPMIFSERDSHRRYL